VQLSRDVAEGEQRERSTRTSKSSRLKDNSRTRVTLTDTTTGRQDRAQGKATTHKETSTLYMSEEYMRVIGN
jgi:hypothetical protein